MVNEVRISNQTADSHGTNVVRRVEERRNWPHAVQPWMGADPPQVRSTRNYFDLSIRFMKKGRRFQRTLSGPNDRDPLTRKVSDLPTFVAMSYLSWT